MSLCFTSHMTTTTRPTVSHITDAEGTGTCSACDREGLRWLVHFTGDQLPVGVECAKRVLGYTPARKNYTPLAGLTLTAQHDDCGNSWALYVSEDGRRSIATLNGVPNIIGQAARHWQARGWAA